MPPLMQLPAYQATQVDPGNFFEPITNALVQYRRGMDEQAKHQLARDQFGLHAREVNARLDDRAEAKQRYQTFMSNPANMADLPAGVRPFVGALGPEGLHYGLTALMQTRNDDIERRKAEAAIDASRASTATSMAQLDQIKMQTPEWRMANAHRFGIDASTPEGKQFVITGNYAPPSETVGHAPEGSILYRNNPRTGQTTFLTPPGGGQQGPFDKAYATHNAPKNYDEAGKAFSEARGTIYTIGDLERVSQYATTGWGASQILEMRRMGAQAGIPNADKIQPAELLQALTQKFVLQEGQKLKPMSNSDVEFVQKGLATIVSDPSTLPVLLPALKREAERTALAHYLAQQAYRTGRPPNTEAIAQEVEQKLPSIIRNVFPAKPGTEPPVEGSVRAPDGAWDIPDKARPGTFIRGKYDPKSGKWIHKGSDGKSYEIGGF